MSISQWYALISRSNPQLPVLLHLREVELERISVEIKRSGEVLRK